MSEKVFVDTSVIQYLHAMGLSHLLKDLFGGVYIPLEVKEEIEIGHIQGVDLPRLDEMDFIKVLGAKAKQQ